ncbi:helix-turn-helix transcriptional regulator [Fodinicola feengrottensis]|uniref:Helix-turn-helix transcriptional regulator n=1 Tax=Fodinicola feengrottensis TaxID=435914 RepID=A0ABN2FQA1_9ACTN|nr:helix-turn-helix transcriptional regulator [Fodinicola feengrottensis]
MLSEVVLAERPDFRVAAVSCRDDHRGWSAEPARTDFRVVLIRRGRFRRRVADAVADLDRTTAYLGVPDEEESFAHPAGGDDCTSIELTRALWPAWAAEHPNPAVYVDARLELAHRRLLAAGHSGDVDYALTERLLALVRATIGQTLRPIHDNRMVTAAREAILAGHPAATGLLPLAHLLAVSPYRLSRDFTAVMGVSLTRYRNRVRAGRALDRLEAGERSLATLAADLGFADQGHLCRTVREHFGESPTALRALITS